MRPLRILTAGVVTMALAVAVVTHLRADDETKASAYGFVERIQYDPPNQNQVKTELSGSEAEPLSGSGGKAALKGVTIKQFAVTGGDPQMIAETPDCIYDPRHKEVSSAAPLTVHAQQGKFFVEGVGFLLAQTNNSLIISNRVHSVMMTTPTTNISVLSGTEIWSDYCKFIMKSELTNGLATYLGNVRVTDPRLKLTSQSLIAELPKSASGQSNQVQHIVAETNVVIDFTTENGEHTHATGQKAVYDNKIVNGVTNAVIELTGEPRVDLTNGWMTADVFYVDRTSGQLLANGHFHFHDLSQRPSGTNAPAQSDIWSDRFTFNLETRLAKFIGHVRAESSSMMLTSEALTTTLTKSSTVSSNNAKSALTGNAPFYYQWSNSASGQMTATAKSMPSQQSSLAQTTNSSRPTHVLAETNVVIDFIDQTNGQHIHATGQQAVYDYHVGDVTNEVLQLTGNPTVEIKPIAAQATNKPSGWMTADLITVDRAQGHIHGSGNQHSVLKKPSADLSTIDSEIFSDTFDFSLATGESVYTGDVRAYNPEMNLASRELTIVLNKGTNGQPTKGVEHVLAKGNVFIDFLEKPFANGDITNLVAFAEAMKRPTNDVTRFVSSQLSIPSQALLGKYLQGKDDDLQTSLIIDLNRIAENDAVYQPARFEGIYLSLDTTKLTDQHPLGIDLVALNRLLLLDAFAGQISRDQKGEKTHATGDEATFDSHVVDGVTNQVLVLTGHPRLEKANGWITAETSIIDDRTTGVIRFVGKPVFHTKLEGLVIVPPPPKPKKKHEKPL